MKIYIQIGRKILPTIIKRIQIVCGTSPKTKGVFFLRIYSTFLLNEPGNVKGNGYSSAQNWAVMKKNITKENIVKIYVCKD